MKTPSTTSVKRAASSAVRRVVHTTYDSLDRQQRRLNPLVPPRQVNPNIGFTPKRAAYAKDFLASGDRIVDMLVAHAGLEPDQRVLDIGSGIGRVARALTTHLSGAGSYQGFDVDPRAVAWCQGAYAPFTNFRFTYAPIGYVNVKGRAPVRGEDFVFPYPDASVDVAFSISVYTHLGMAVVDRYIAETSRVLRPGGVCVNTFFVMDDVAIAAMRDRRADRAYVDQGDGTWVHEPLNPNLGIGFSPNAITSLHEGHALVVDDPVHFGTWTGRTAESFVYQDVVVARKPTGIRDAIRAGTGGPAPDVASGGT